MTGLSWGIEGLFDGPVFGVDEVGRGPWAGPVVAAAVCLWPDAVPPGLADSKALSAAGRQRLAAALAGCAACALGEASVAEIDAHNIRKATHMAMARAVDALVGQIGPPAMVLVDGNAMPGWEWRARAVVRGDRSVASIAAAGIVAKVARDAQMIALSARHPSYGWARNKGYGTAEHALALDRHGITPHHRRSFAPVRKHIRALSLSGNNPRGSRAAQGGDSTDCVAAQFPHLESTSGHKSMT